jgi:hypothetical protein
LEKIGRATVAESTFERADHGIVGVRGQRGATFLAIRFHAEHGHLPREKHVRKNLPLAMICHGEWLEMPIVGQILPGLALLLSF